MRNRNYEGQSEVTLRHSDDEKRVPVDSEQVRGAVGDCDIVCVVTKHAELEGIYPKKIKA